MALLHVDDGPHEVTLARGSHIRSGQHEPNFSLIYTSHATVQTNSQGWPPQRHSRQTNTLTNSQQRTLTARSGANPNPWPNGCNRLVGNATQCRLPAPSLLNTRRLDFGSAQTSGNCNSSMSVSQCACQKAKRPAPSCINPPVLRATSSLDR